MSRSFNRHASGSEAALPRRGGTDATGGEPLAPGGQHVASAAEAAPDHGVGPAPLTITLCDGSQFTFSRFADLRVTADV